MQTRAVLRFCTVCFICIAVLIFNISEEIKLSGTVFSAAFQNSDVFTVSNDIKNDKPEEKEEKEPPKNEEKKENTSSAAGSAVETSASAVKGKITEKYISPYKAPISYNNVYVKNNTSLKLDIKEFLNSKLSFKISKNNEPQVLIVHTHTTETFMTENTNYYTESFSSRSRDNSKNMAKIGDIVAERLNSAGIKTLHDTTQHDYPNYTGSYTRSEKTVRSYLKKYPSIKVVLDLHRDAVTDENGNKVKLATTVNNKKAAQVMLVMGSQSGTVTGFPDWKENFKLAVRLQKLMEEKYPTLARPMTLNSKLYNQNLTKGSLLIEFGTDVNTLEEACYSGELVGNALAELLGNIN